MTNIASSPYAGYYLRGDGRVLELRWTPATADMSEEDFRSDMLTFAELAVEHGPSVLLVDATQFAHRMSDATGQWRSEEIIPRYNRAGVQKLSFLLPAAAGDMGEPAPERGATFVTGWFTDRDLLEQWIDPAT